MAHVVGLGTLAMDVLIQVDRLPGADGFAVVNDRTPLPGGSGTNVIAQAARLGAECTFLGKVGDDATGQAIIASLREEGVNADSMPVLPGGRSLSTTVVVDSDGQRFILLDLGDAFGTFSAEEVDLAAISGADVFYTDLLPWAAARAGLAAAVRAGVPIVVGMEVDLPTMHGLGVSTDDILSAMALAEVFLPCRDGLTGLAGSSDLEAGLAFLAAQCPGTSIVTLGAAGAIAVTATGERVTVPGVPVTPVDTTGAGDAFAGALLAFRYVDRLEIGEAVRLANAVAAASCTTLGARSGPNRDELSAFLSTTTKE